MKIIDGKVFYQIRLEKEPATRLELMQFLKDKGFRDVEIAKLDFDYAQGIGKNVLVEGRDVKLTFKVGETALMLMFETKKDSAEMAEYIRGYFV